MSDICTCTGRGTPDGCAVHDPHEDLRQEVERLTQERDHLRAVIDGLRAWLEAEKRRNPTAATVILVLSELARLLGACRSQDAVESSSRRK